MKGVKVDMQWRQIAKLWEPCQELSYLEGSHPHLSGSQVCRMCGAAKEIGFHVDGGAAGGTGGVISPAIGVAVGLEPRAVAGTEMGEGASVELGQQLFVWVNWRGE